MNSILARICYAFLIFWSIGLCSQEIYINEFMSKNDNGIVDFEGETSDWIELYYNGVLPLNLGGYSLSDNLDDANPWVFPDVEMQPGTFLLVWASGKDGVFETELHTNFSISSTGEDLVLKDLTGTVLDSIEKSLDPDESYGRLTDGGPGWVKFIVATPNASNEEGIPKYYIEFSHDSGIYPEEVDLEITGTDSVDIYVTMDGSEPGLDDALYTTCLSLGDRIGDPDVLSIIQCTVEPYAPSTESKKANIIRARAFLAGIPVSKIYTRTYLIEPNSERYQIPVISLVSEADNFFDSSTGICPNYNGAGFDWERPVHFEYFDESGSSEFRQDCGIRIHGGSSRGARQKPFKLYARSDYGDPDFDYPFFDSKEIESFKRLVLRTPRSQNQSYMTDELVNGITNGMHLEQTANDQVIVFLNGEYWGLYHLREKLDKYFYKENLGVDTDDLVMVINNPIHEYNCEEGDCSEILDGYWNFVENLDSSNVTQQDYDSLDYYLDLDNYIDYLITEFYVGNGDWPWNNSGLWKVTGEGNKLRQMIYDFDFSMGSVSNNSMGSYYNNVSFSSWGLKPGRYLFQVQDFENRFVEQFEFLLNNNFSKESVIEQINEIAHQMEPHMQEYFDRFDLGIEVQYWKEKVQESRYFAAHRPCEIQTRIESYFDELIEIGPCELLLEDSIYMYVPEIIDTISINNYTVILESDTIIFEGDTIILSGDEISLVNYTIVMGTDTIISEYDTLGFVMGGDTIAIFEMIDTMMIDTMSIDTMMHDTIPDTMLSVAPINYFNEFEALDFWTANKQLFVKCNLLTSSISAQLNVFNLAGQLVFSKDFAAQSNSQNVFSPNLLSGIYIIKVEIDGEIYSKRLFFF